MRLIVCVDDDDGEVEFDSATRYSTDEHNNLQIWGGRQGDRLVRVFARGYWTTVGIENED